MTWPLLLTTLGGVLVLIGSVWTAIKQTKAGAESAKANTEARELTKEIAARLGDQKLVDELVEARSRLVSADRRANDHMIRDIITQLPQVTADYLKLKQSTAAAENAIATNVRLSWEPLIRFCVTEFDRCVDELQARGVAVKVKKDDDFVITKAGDERTFYDVRLVSIDNVTLSLAYVNGGVTAYGMRPCGLWVNVSADGKFDSRPFYIEMDMNEAKGGGMDIPAPKDGIPPKELTEAFTIGVGKGIERLLVITNAKK
jgi:hypothetical protein